ncbi:SIMPL domain-containing protein [Polycladidibacter hongkongensis]|uniref:SIMPL domain-containing protein n=1 Tax=Polycladidibacter hongkongensis TaxID=1647556 RepID=UPI0008316307|nr:SIMPL domain-containing protein [Pseudovibrio hongkongensis]
MFVERGFISSALICLALVGAPAIAAAEQPEKQPAVVTVTGTGSVFVEPDKAVIRASVLSTGKEAAAALTQNSKTMQAIMAVLRKQGLEPRQMQTSGFGISPIYSRPEPGKPHRADEPPKIIGYQVNNGLAIIVKDLDNLGPLIDRLAKSGANSISDISFQVSDRSLKLDEARRFAVADARRKAELYASSAGVQLGQPLKIAEAGSNHYPMQEMRMMTKAMDAAPPMAAGQEQLTTSVTIVYALK